MEAMPTQLVPVVAMALELPPDYFNEAFAEPNCTIRLIHYPPHSEPEENEFGFAPHTDNNFLTFLAQSATTGSRGAHGRGRMDPAPGGAWDLCRQHRGDAGPIFERPLPGHTA